MPKQRIIKKIMSSEIIIGGSKGIAEAYLNRRANVSEMVSISRSKPATSNVTHHALDVLTDDLPDVDTCDHLIYFPGSINLKPFSSLMESDFQEDFRINVLGAIRVIKKYLPLLKKSENGSITLFSTVAVAQGMPFHASVAVAKAGVEGLMKSLAAELAPKIRVNCLALNITDTPLAERILRNEKARESIAERQPLKRILTAEEVAEMTEFVAVRAKGMTGQVVLLDLGLSTLRP
jgi:NAD(P)-dependent dehydrogenase (short-subunit alcohol dehydrogenase family)